MFFISIINNLFSSNFAIFAACMDFETPKGIIISEKNLFYYNAIKFSANDAGVGAGSVIVLNGILIELSGQNNSYVSNLGFMKGKIIV